MNRETVLKLAREAGFKEDMFGIGIWDCQEFNNFAQACCEWQKEKDAKICLSGSGKYNMDYSDGKFVILECAAAIRNQGGE